MSHTLDLSNLKSTARQFGESHLDCCYIGVLGKEKYVSQKDTHFPSGSESLNQSSLLLLFGGGSGDPRVNLRKAEECERTPQKNAWAHCHTTFYFTGSSTP